MNALANDQRKRLGAICKALYEATSKFCPTFGQYIGQTPEDIRDTRRNARARRGERLPGELVFREEMRTIPPHILLTNYSMLEYLMIRRLTVDCLTAVGGKALEVYRPRRGAPVPRHQRHGDGHVDPGLKERLHSGGRHNTFRCIATSATISSGEGEAEKTGGCEFCRRTLWRAVLRGRRHIRGISAEHR